MESIYSKIFSKPSTQLPCEESFKQLTVLFNQHSSASVSSLDWQENCKYHIGIITSLNNAEHKKLLIEKLIDITIELEPSEAAQTIYTYIYDATRGTEHENEALARYHFSADTHLQETKREYPELLTQIAQTSNRVAVLYHYAFYSNNNSIDKARVLKHCADKGYDRAKAALNALLANNDNATTNFELYKIYTSVVPNPEKAIQHLIKTAESGDVDAMVLVGNHYLNLCYAKKNSLLFSDARDENLSALKFFNAAKELGSIEGKIGLLKFEADIQNKTESRYQLGKLHLDQYQNSGEDNIKNKDFNAAQFHLKKAADKGSEPAIIMLAQFYGTYYWRNDHEDSLKRRLHPIAIKSETNKLIEVQKNIVDPDHQLTSQATINALQETISNSISLIHLARHHSKIHEIAEFVNQFSELVIKCASLKSEDNNCVMSTHRFLGIFQEVKILYEWANTPFTYRKQLISEQTMMALYAIAAERGNKYSELITLKAEADKGNARSQYLYANQCNKPETARRYYEMAANQDHAEAAGELAFHYLNTFWLPINSNKVLTKNYLNKMTPDTLPKEKLASYGELFFHQGDEFKTTDPEKAQLCYEKAAELGHKVAEAIALMRKANQKNTDAEFQFGMRCMNRELPKDNQLNAFNNDREGYRYLLRAADNGHGEAAFIVAQAHVAEWKCVPKPSPRLADKYFNIAVNSKAKGAEVAYMSFKSMRMPEPVTAVKTFSAHEDL